MQAVVGAGATRPERAHTRDAEFAEYMHARQDGLPRTAYLLTGGTWSTGARPDATA